MNTVRRAFISTLRPATRRMAPFAAGRRGMAEAAGGIPQKLTLNLLAPHEAIFSNQGLCAAPSDDLRAVRAVAAMLPAGRYPHPPAAPGQIPELQGCPPGDSPAPRTLD